MLKENPRVEQDQKEYEILKREISLHENRMKNQYADIVSDFSKMHTYFAAPLLQQVVDLLKDVELDYRSYHHILAEISLLSPRLRHLNLPLHHRTEF